MSLETLLEAAEFLESRGEGGDNKKGRLGVERQFSEPGTSADVPYTNIALKSARPRTKSGSVAPLYDGPSDHFFLRAGTREVHNKLEKNRRAHLKECFDFLKKNIPSLEDRRTSNLGILRTSLRYIQNLKRKEREFELEMQRFAHEKIVLQDRIHSLKSELNKMNIDIDFNFLAVEPDEDNDSNSTSTATERGTPPPSDHDEQDDDEEEAENLAMETNSPTMKMPRKRKHSFTKDNLPTGMKPPTPKIQPNVMPMNGMITKSSSAPALFLQQKHSPKKNFKMKERLFELELQKIAHATINPGPAAFEMSVTGKILELPPVKTPVTQILHRTLQQRQQALLTQKVKPATTVARASSAPLTAAQLKSPPLSQPSSAMSMTTSHVANQSSTSSLIVKDGVPASTKLLSNNAARTSTNVGTTMSIPYYMASLQKIAHPVLVTSLMAPAVGLQSTTAAPVCTPTVMTSLAPGTSALSVKSTRQEPVNALTLTNNNVKTLNNVPTFAIVSSATKMETTSTVASSMAATSLSSASIPIRPIYTPNLLPGQLAWPFLTIPRSNVLVTSTSGNSIQGASPVTTTSQVTSNPLVSLAQLNHLTQMMTPMTVMSPGMQMTPTALTQAQLNSMFASPLLKQFPLGIQSSLLQTGQVLGQQVLKPVVVVTVPNVMTQTQATTLPSNTALVTSSL